ncbi:elongator complex protein 6-like [Xylocopa sonorina]|uniref:elongator complex protein 6-like n=1 Tax=Xylocopa sonorina TaxID=1818115 RepID=UPI00403A8471
MLIINRKLHIIMDSVSNILGIDKVDMNGKLIVIEERHGSDANFLLSTVISNALKKNYDLCFVLFHNTFNHYHNVGMKFGYNLGLQKEKGKIVVVEPMKVIASNIECIHDQRTNNILNNVFIIIKNECCKIMRENKPVVIIIDDASHFSSFNCDSRESVCYLRYLRSLVERYSMSHICIVTHTYKDEFKDCASNVIARGLRQMAHLFVKVEPLESGYSSDASGNLTVNWRSSAVRVKYKWPEVARYIYKLSNRQVKVCAPGASIL